ncbi:MAG: hypothetical protein GXP33_09350 [Spirochaetes bacterium]|nr:hypothetical protein [Spirochaetota bacterium]
MELKVLRSKRFSVLFTFLILMIYFIPSVHAKTITTVKITAMAGVTKIDDDIGISGIVQSSLIVKSSGNKNVRGYLELAAYVTDTVKFDIPRLYIKARFPGFRITAGKNRVSWGEGFLFNAGDIIFEGAGLLRSLSYDVLRTETDWLADIYIPLGLFSFAEGIVLPFPAGSAAPSSSFTVVHWNNARYGGRIVTQLAGIKLEAGGLYTKNTVTPYISFQGHLFADIYSDCSVILPEGAVTAIVDAVKDSLTITAGFMRQISVQAGGIVTVRMETRVMPYGLWTQTETASAGSDPGYGIFLYPELSYAPDTALNFSVRSLISLIDLSGIVFAGTGWNVYQGLDIMVQAGLQFGESGGIWGWNRNGGISCSAGFRYRY